MKFNLTISTMLSDVCSNSWIKGLSSQIASPFPNFSPADNPWTFGGGTCDCPANVLG